MAMEYNSLGEFLKEWRLDRCLTQEQMATKLGIVRTTYVRIENGHQRAGVVLLASIAETTKRSASFLRKLNEKNK